MAAEGNYNNTGKKQSRSQRRRDTENEVFGELADLLPVSQDMKQDKLSILRLTVAYLKLKDGIQTDVHDLEECLASISESPASSIHDLEMEPEQPPLAMLDNDGNLIAGSLHRNPPSNEPASITLPDQVVSELEEQFMSASEQSDVTEVFKCKEKLQKYKEGLEKGMQDFLGQDLYDIHSDYNKSSSATMIHGEKEQILCPKNSKGVKDDTVITKAPYSSVVSKKRDQLLRVSEPVQESSLILEAATGFILTLDKDKRVLFVSENVSEFLGHCQSYMIGQDVSEFIYEKDYPELERQMSNTQFQQGTDRLQLCMIRKTFFMALKFCFQKSGSRMKDSGFQLYQWNAKLRLYKDSTSGDIHVKGLTALCCPLERDTMLSFNDNANFFMMRFSIKDTRILYCDPKIYDLLGYSPSELIGLKHTDLKHPSDTVMCKYNYRKLPVEGKCESGYYRLLSRSGTWVWLYSKLNIIFNRHGVAEVLVVRNIIVSQAEALCVLSRERKDFDEIKIKGYSDDLFTQGMSAATLATISFDKKRKKRKTILNAVPSDVLRSRVKSASISSSENATFSKFLNHLPKEKPCQPQLQKSKTLSHVHSSNNRLCLSQKSKDSKTSMKATASNTDKKQNGSQIFLDRAPVASNIVKLMRQTLVRDFVSRDTYQNSDCSNSFVSSIDPPLSLTDSDSSVEMPCSQQMINDMSSMTPSSSSPLQFSSSEQEWSIDSLLFDNNQDYRLLQSSSNISCPLLGQINLNGSDMDSAKINDNDQLQRKGKPSVDPENTDSSYSSQTSASGRLSPQSYSDLLMSDDKSLGGVLDFLTDEFSPASDALMMPSSGDVMLSILTAPQPIITRPNQALKSPSDAIGFQNIASETKSKNKQCLPGNLTCDDRSTVSSYETMDKIITPGHIAYTKALKYFQSLCDPPPVVAGQSDIIYSPGKLDYPPLTSMLRHNHKDNGAFHDHIQQKQKVTSNPVFNTEQMVGSLCNQNDHNKFEILRDTSISLTNIPDKISQGSVCQTEYGSWQSNLKFTTAGQDKKTVISTSKEKGDKGNPEGSMVPVFCETLDKFINSFDFEITGANVINKDILEMRSKNNSASSSSSENVTDSQESVDTAVNLPDDLVDLEIDGDIAVNLSDNWMNYL